MSETQFVSGKSSVGCWVVRWSWEKAAQGRETLICKQSKPALFFNSGYEPRFDPDLCVACETCIDRCPPDALVMGENDVPEVNLESCFGCAVCASGCPSDAIVMESKPDFPVPPRDMKELVTSIKASFAKSA